VGAGTGSLVLTRVQPAGKPEMDAGDWWRGLPEGVRFRA
jgi:methionyl-tRNA formyltransferase